MTAMFERLRSLFRWPRPVTPAWRTLQSVSYSLEREDGSWASFTLHALTQTETGAWVVAVTCKTAAGEALAHLQCTDKATTPLKAVSLRTSPGWDLRNPRNLVHDPRTCVALATQLLMVRSWDSAREALKGPPEPFSGPCGVREVHALVVPAGDHQKHLRLSPRVALTGVVSQSIDGRKNPVILRAMGCADPKARPKPGVFDDFVDLGHPRTIEFAAFSLTFPATWFTNVEERMEGELKVEGYSARQGGATCSLSLRVDLFTGSEAALDRHLAMLQAGWAKPDGSLRPVGPVAGLEGGLRLEMTHPSIQGVVFARPVREPGRMAVLTAIGCCSADHPDRAGLSADFEQALPAVLGSLRFRPLAGG